MNPPRPENQLPIPALPPAAYDELLDYLRQSRSPLSPAEALVKANTPTINRKTRWSAGYRDTAARST